MLMATIYTARFKIQVL